MLFERRSGLPVKHGKRMYDTLLVRGNGPTQQGKDSRAKFFRLSAVQHWGSRQEGRAQHGMNCVQFFESMLPLFVVSLSVGIPGVSGRCLPVELLAVIAGHGGLVSAGG